MKIEIVGRSWSNAALVLCAVSLTAWGQGRGQIRRLIDDIDDARKIDLTFIWDEASPIAGVNPPYAFSLAATHANTLGTFGDNNQLSFTSEIMNWSGQHGAPSIDAIGHIGRNGTLFGGVNAAAATSDPRGIGRGGVGAELGIDRFPLDLILNRGVLLDVARQIQGDGTPLPAGYEITAADLQATAAAQRVNLRRGDTVYIRTGWGQYFKNNPAFYAGDNAAGPGLGAAQWLVQQGAKIVGADTLTFEKRPPLIFSPQFQVFPVHMFLIADNGVYIIENLDLEELARERAYEFVAINPPLKVRGGTGSALRSIALINGRDRHGRDRD